MTLSVRIATTLAEFAAMEPEWMALFAVMALPLPFLRHAWLMQCWRYFPRKRPIAIMVFDDGVPVMAAAFTRSLRRLVPTVQLLDSGTPQIDDVLVRPSDGTTEQAALLLATLRRHSRFYPRFRSRFWREDCALRLAMAGCRSKLRERAQGVHVELAEYPDWPKYLESRSHNLRVDHRRRVRQLERTPGFAFERLEGPQKLAALGWLFEAKKRWVVEHKKRADWLVKRGGDRFLTEIATREDGPPNWVTTLRIGERIIAAALCYVERDTVFLTKFTYDPEFGQVSPGRTLLLLTAQQAMEAGYRRFDMLVGTTDYKLRIGEGVTDYLVEKIWIG